MKSTLVVSAACLACLLPISILNAAPSNASATNAAAKADTHPKKHITEQLSRQATHMLQQVQEAAQAVAAKQTQSAITHIDQALTDRTQLASLARANSRPMIVPLYSEFDDTSVLGPVLAARKGAKQPSMSSPITVDDASAQYTFVGLDLDKTKARLDAARTALHNNNPQAASDSLAAVGTDLVVDTEKTDFPLLAARENLGIAEAAVKDHHYREATAALKEASIAVDRYAKENSAHHAQEARDLHQKIDSLSQTVAQNHSGAANTIDNWWHEVDGWFSREVHA